MKDWEGCGGETSEIGGGGWRGWKRLLPVQKDSHVILWSRQQADQSVDVWGLCIRAVM